MARPPPGGGLLPSVVGEFDQPAGAAASAGAASGGSGYTSPYADMDLTGSLTDGAGLPRKWVDLLQQRGVSSEETSRVSAEFAAAGAAMHPPAPLPLPGLGSDGSFLSAGMSSAAKAAAPAPADVATGKSTAHLQTHADSPEGQPPSPFALLEEVMGGPIGSVGDYERQHHGPESGAGTPDRSLRASRASVASGDSEGGMRTSYSRGLGDISRDSGGAAAGGSVGDGGAFARALDSFTAGGLDDISSTSVDVMTPSRPRDASQVTSGAGTNEDSAGPELAHWRSAQSVSSLARSLNSKQLQIDELRVQVTSLTEQRDRLQEALEKSETERHRLQRENELLRSHSGVVDLRVKSVDGADGGAPLPADIEVLQDRVASLERDLRERDETIEGFRKVREQWDVEREEMMAKLGSSEDDTRDGILEAIRASDNLLGTGDAPRILAEDTAAGKALSSILEGMTHEKAMLYESLQSASAQVEQLTFESIEDKAKVARFEGLAKRLSMERLLLLAAQRSVGRGFHTLKEAVLQERTDNKWRLIMIWLRRLALNAFPHLMDSGPMWMAFHSWRNNVRQLVHNRRLLAKFTLHMRAGSTLRCFNAWTAFVAERRRVRRLAARVFTAVVSRSLLAGFRRWKEHVASANKGDFLNHTEHLRTEVAHLKEELGRTEAQLAHANRVRQHNADMIRQQAELTYKARRVGLLARSIREWRENAAEEKRLRILCKRVGAMWMNAGLTRVFRAWREWAAGERHAREVVARFTKQWQNRGIAKALQSWKTLWRIRREARTSAEFHYRRQQARLLRQCFSAWANERSTGKLERLHEVRQVEKAAAHHAAALRKFYVRVLRAWRADVAEDVRQRRVLAAFVFRMKNAGTMRVLRAWALYTREIRRDRRLMQLVCDRVLYNSRRQALSQWHRFVAHRQKELETENVRRLEAIIAHLKQRNHAVAERMYRARSRALLAVSVSEWRRAAINEKRLRNAIRWFANLTGKRVLGRVLSAWREYAIEKKRLRVVSKKVMNMWVNAGLSRVIRAWIEHTKEAKRERELLARFGARLRNRSLFSMLRRWQILVADAKEVRERAEVLFVEHQQRVVSDALRSWAENVSLAKTERERAQLDEAEREEMEAKMRRILQRWQGNSLASTFKQWRENVKEVRRNRRIVAGFLARMQQAGVVRTFNRWVEYTHARQNARALAAKVMGRALNRSQFSGFRMWQQFVVAAKEGEARDLVKAAEREAYEHTMASRRHIAEIMARGHQRELLRRCLASWATYSSTQKTNRVLVERFRVSAAHRRLTATFAHWRSSTQTDIGLRRKTQSHVSLLARRRLRRAMRLWQDTMRQCRRVDAMIGRSEMKLCRAAFAGWVAFHGDARVERKELDARRTLGAAKRDAALALLSSSVDSVKRSHFTTWKTNVKELIRIRGVLARVANRIRNAGVSMSLNRWAQFTRERKFARFLLGRVFAGAELRMKTFCMKKWALCVGVDAASLLERLSRVELDASEAAQRSALAISHIRHVAATALFRHRSCTARAFKSWLVAASFSTREAKSRALTTVMRACLRMSTATNRHMAGKLARSRRQHAMDTWRMTVRQADVAADAVLSVTTSQRAVAEAHQAMSSIATVGGLFSNTEEILASSYGAKAVGSVFVLDSSRGDLWTISTRTGAKRRSPIGKGLAGAAAADSVDICLEDARGDSRVDAEVDTVLARAVEAIAERGARAHAQPIRCMVTPSRDSSSGNVLAVLMVARAGGDPFSDADLAQLSTTACFVGASLQRLSRAAARRAAQQESASSIKIVARKAEKAQERLAELEAENERLQKETTAGTRYVADLEGRASKVRESLSRASAAESALDELQRQLSEQELLLRRERERVSKLERELEQEAEVRRATPSQERRIAKLKHERLLMSVDLGNARNEVARLQTDLDFLSSAVREMLDHSGHISDTRREEVVRIVRRVAATRVSPARHDGHSGRRKSRSKGHNSSKKSRRT